MLYNMLALPEVDTTLLPVIIDTAYLFALVEISVLPQRDIEKVENGMGPLCLCCYSR